MLKHNTKIYKFLNLFSFPVFWQPVLFLFFTVGKELSATQALLMTSIYSLAVVILEVPGGAISDHYSRKLSASLGYLIKGSGLLALTFFSNIYALIVCMILAAYGESLISGSIESLMYDTVSMSKGTGKKRFKHLFAQTRSILHLAMALYIVIGGYLGKISLALPFQVSFGFYLIASYISLQFEEPAKESDLTKNYLDHIKDGFHFIFSKQGRDSGIMMLMFADYFILGLISATFWITTPLLDNIGQSIVTIGIFTATMRILKSLSAKLVSKLDDDNDLRSMLYSTAIICITFFLAGIFYSPITVVLSLFILYFTQAFYQANNVQLLNDRIGSVDRTTINSIQSMFKRFYEFSILPLLGMFFDRDLAQYSLITISVLLSIGIFIIYTNRHKLSPEFYDD